MRPSTVRKLEHTDMNVLLNTTVDMAISHYYNYIINENGTFDIQEEKNKNSKEVKKLSSFHLFKNLIKLSFSLTPKQLPFVEKIKCSAKSTASIV